jgi:RNA polymerase subunit RPABC4/transcription elongation factor Spt4
MTHHDMRDKGTGSCHCPYCGEESVAEAPPYCQPCGVTLRYCTVCETVVDRQATVCPDCGGELGDKAEGRT